MIFKNFLTDNWKTRDDSSIINVAGKSIETFVVEGYQGQKVWDTRKIKQGVYLYTFTVNGISKSGKIIISK